MDTPQRVRRFISKDSVIGRVSNHARIFAKNSYQLWN